MSMSIPYALTGRTKQKSRTRSALLAAARDVLATGHNPTVEQVADLAGISRATAYRYFPNRRALLVATFPELAEESLLPDPAPADPAERLRIVTRSLVRQLLAHEQELRAQLRLSLEPGPSADGLPFRTGRAIGWIDEALAPLRESLGPAEQRKLVLAIRTAVGIEALVWLTDVAGLTREQASEQMVWSADALLRGTHA